MALNYGTDGLGDSTRSLSDLQRRRALALAMLSRGMQPQEIRSWTQGAAQLASALFGGLNLRAADRAEAKLHAGDASNLSEGLSAYIASQRSAPQISDAQPQDDTPTPPIGQTGEDIQFDPKMLRRDYTGPVPEGAQYSPDDRDKLIRTAAFEAGDPQGRQAVAESMLNRSKARGISPAEVSQQPHQYEPWATKPDELNALDTNSPTYKASADAVDQALHGGGDITGGATDFLSPSVMAQRGDPLPSWAQGPGQDIGGNRFFGGSPGQQQVASAMQPQRLAPADAGVASVGAPTDITPHPAAQPQVAQAPYDAGAPVAGDQGQLPWLQGQQGQQPTGIPAIDSGQVSREEAVTKLMSVVNSESATDQQRSTASALLEKLLVQKDPTWGIIGEGGMGGKEYGWIDPSHRQIEHVSGQGGGAGMPEITDNSPRGKEFLSGVPAKARGTVQAMLEGRIAPPASSRLSSPYWQTLMAYATQVDPGFDATKWASRVASRREFTAGNPNSPAGSITAGNAAIKHLRLVSDSSENIGGDYMVGWPGNHYLNEKRNEYKQSAGTATELAKFNAELGKFVEEATKFYRGLGGTEADLQREMKQIDPAMSVSERRAAIAANVRLMEEKISALQQRWHTAMDYTTEPVDDFPIVYPDSQEAVKAILARENAPLPGADAGANNSGGAAPPGVDPEDWKHMPDNMRALFQ
jgi:hypothetical protein